MSEYILEDNKFVINTDVTDWYEELIKEEPNIKTVEDAVETMLSEKRHPAQMGRMCLIAELLGKTEEEIVGMPKPLLQTAVAFAFQSQLARRKTTAKTASGKDVNVREIIAPVAEIDEDTGEEEPSDKPHVRVTDPLAGEYAMKYLMNRVPGYIRGRLNVIALHGGDVRLAADTLKSMIDEMVTELT